MKTNIKKLISLILAAVMTLSCLALTSCGDSSATALKLGDFKITEAMYSYWASSYKGSYMYSYSDIKNTDEYWNSEIEEGVTVAEYFDDLTLDAVKAIRVNEKLFDENRLSFTEKEEQAIDDYISDLIVERAEGSKNMMNTLLGEYGINLKILKRIYLAEEKASKVYNCLFGEGGEMEVDDEEYDTFYKENYVRFQLIYINNAYKYTTDDEGNRITDEDGYYVTEDLSKKEKEKKDAKVKAVVDGLGAGGDFDELYDEYSELKSYKNGYYYSAAESYSDALYYRLVAEAQKLKVGEWTSVESDTGTCIIKKMELDEKPWENKENDDFFGEGGESFKDLVSETAYREFIESYFDDIKVDEDIIKKYSVKNVTPAYFF